MRERERERERGPNLIKSTTMNVITAVKTVIPLQLRMKYAERARNPYIMPNVAAVVTESRLLWEGPVISHISINEVIPPGMKKPIRKRPNRKK